MKMRILMVVMLLASIVMFSTGAFAYFTASRTSTSTVSAGTLGIKIAASPSLADVPANEAFADTATPWTFDKMVPGQVETGCLWLMNTGNVGTMRALYDFSVISTTGAAGGNVNLADRLQLTSVFTSDNGFNYIPGMLKTAWDPNNDGIVTLQEMANYGGDWQSDIDPFVSVAPGGKGAICMTFNMINGTPDVDNLYQGAVLKYSALVTAFNPSH